MDNRTKGLIATIASVLLCGCPGLFLCIFGVGTATGSGTYSLGADAGNIPASYGYVFICLSLLLILIPVVVGYLTLRRKTDAPVDVIPPPPNG